ncbi:hypothetical protein SAMN05660284_00959 [Formivibrio citricus]|uniref:Aminoglycoside phosphotransferase domain-containing protein n=1 Tax=Formivibrio citricus TaxID=83765 RepID=A0A1I4XDJ4_9NEIS|nr:bifunctional aminoglycoside phosphotransferase/ATP-binding protein [Formivibrio citricus]SFN23563.1 hypothetical protein SAMN05660284_00959 [Formivibrio citricus]
MTSGTAPPAQRQLVEALKNPACYPHPVDEVCVIETHISFVLLTGPFAYKIKKAVDLGFVDYTTLEKRRFYCNEELRLNRRLAPQLYLETVVISGAPDSPRFGQDDGALEYAVKMRQFSQQDLLDQVLARNGQGEVQVDALAAELAGFHQCAPIADAQSPWGSPECIRAPVDANFAFFRERPDACPLRLAELQRWSEAELARLEPVFRQRKAQGLVRECHGDLHLGNMLLFDGQPLVFDCIEFSDELRWIDVFNDLAFLTMDLAVHGRPDHAWRLLNGWLEITGDYAGLETWRFYEVYRALVRAKVAGLRAQDTALAATEREAANASQSAYLDFATAALQPRTPAVIVTHGFSGSGKSTAARQLAASFGAVCLRSDVERKRLHGLPPLARSGSAIGGGLYTTAATTATYEYLKTLAETIVSAGCPVIVDAAFLLRWQRQLFRDLAQAKDIPFLILDCQAPASVLLQRLAVRVSHGYDASEANPAVLAQQLANADALGEDERGRVVVVDTAQDGIGKALEEIGGRLQINRV